MPNPRQPLFRQPRESSQQRPKGLRQGGSLKKTRLKVKSKKRRLESAKYEILKLAHFTNNPRCEHPDGCFKTWPFYDMDLHHAAGRSGPLYTCTRYFRTACRFHHNMAKDDPITSEANGWIVRLRPDRVRRLKEQKS